MEYQFSNLTEMLIVAVKKAFLDVIEKNPDDNFYAFSLILHETRRYITASINSLENHKKICAEFHIEENTPDEEYYRWSPWEWRDFEFVGNEHFKDVDLCLSEIVQQFDDDEEMDEGFNDLIEVIVDNFDEEEEKLGKTDNLDIMIRFSMVESLTFLKNENFFKLNNKRKNIVVFIHDFGSDGDLSDLMSGLNDEAEYELFCNRYFYTNLAENDKEKLKKETLFKLNELPLEEKIESCKVDILDWQMNYSESDSFEKGNFILDRLLSIGDSALPKLIEFLRELILRENSHLACSILLDAIAEWRSSKYLIRSEVAELFIMSCNKNISNNKWNLLPYKMAKIFSDGLFLGLEEPCIDGKNVLNNYDYYIDRCNQILNLGAPESD